MFQNLVQKMLGGKQKEKSMSRDEIADLLKINPELLTQFENAYQPILEAKEDNFFNVNAKQAAAERKENKLGYSGENIDSLVSRIVEELLVVSGLSQSKTEFIKAEDINQLPLDIKPQLTGNLIQKDIGVDSYPSVLEFYKKFTETGDMHSYHMFRQGLDILDLDPILYEIIGTNKNSIGNWFPQLKLALDGQEFFKYPETKIVKVPLPILQLTRLDYFEHTPTTINILNEFCMRAFELDVKKDYFIKTGTYSSKFDFQNALVSGEKEVRELGEYLLYIHFQALQMASPLSTPSIYGVSTTNEWVVREFIEDVEENPTIYKGMPLRTEYRFFVDFDTPEILGVSPYWREDVMIRSLNMNPEDPHKKHDYVIYKMHEEKLYEKYNDNVENLKNEVSKLMGKIQLNGQWSLDIMQNGDDFYVIDMADAASSALSDCVPKGLLKKSKENWIPRLNG